MMLIDTNVFLELLLGQRRAEDCRRYLEVVSEGKLEAVVTRYSLHAVESILCRPELISEFIAAADRSAGLHVFETGNADELGVALLMNGTGLDFDDALQYYVAKRTGAEAIVSFDKHFDKTDLPRIEPAEALEFLKPANRKKKS